MLMFFSVSLNFGSIRSYFSLFLTHCACTSWLFLQKDGPLCQLLLKTSVVSVPLFLQPYFRSDRLDSLFLQSRSLPNVTCILYFHQLALHLNPAQRHNPKQFPFKGESDLSPPLLTPPLSDRGPTLTYCGVGDRVTTTLPR